MTPLLTVLNDLSCIIERAAIYPSECKSELGTFPQKKHFK